MVSSHARGHKIIHQGNAWVYADTGELVKTERPCKCCGKMPTPEGYDACLGEIPGVISACCGHGIEGGEAKMMFAKPGRIKDKVLLAEVRKAGCSVAGCRNKAQAAHIRPAGGDTPENVMPLCQSHHINEQHIIGWKRFRERHPEVKSWKEIQEAKA